MAQFGTGNFVNPYPDNQLFDVVSGNALEASRQNQLLTQEKQQNIGAKDLEVASRIAAAVLELQDPAARAEAYQTLTGMAQQRGFLSNAPTTYPGDERVTAVARFGVPPKDLWERGQNDTAKTGMFPGPGSATTPAPGGPPSGGASPLVPFRAANLPDGVTPQEDQIVRTVIGEAGGEQRGGQVAVAHVIKTRGKAHGDDTEAAIFRPNAFEPWNNPTTRAKLEALSPDDPQYQDILKNVVRPVMAGQVEDPTQGATHFYSPKLQAQLGRAKPAWATGDVTAIGGHDFFYAPYSAAAPGGGVATRTGGTQVAGPPGTVPGGPLMDPVTGAPIVPPEPRTETGYTARQNVVLDALKRNRGTTAAQLAAQMNTFNDDNRQADTAYRVAVAAADKARRDQEKEQRPLQGEAISAQDRSTLQSAKTDEDRKSVKYHDAYANVAMPKLGQDGLLIYPHVSQFKKPLDTRGNEVTTYDSANIAIGPGDIGKLRTIVIEGNVLKQALDTFVAEFEKASYAERVAAAAGKPSPLTSAWTNAAMLAKGDALFQLGVLSGPDMSVLQGALTSPKSFMGLLNTSADTRYQANRIKDIIDARQAEAQRVYGMGLRMGVPAAAAPAQPAGGGGGTEKVIIFGKDGKRIP